MRLLLIFGATLTLSFLILIETKVLSQIECESDADCPTCHLKCASAGICKEVLWCDSDCMCDPGECCMIPEVSNTTGYCGKIPKANEFCWTDGGGIGACPCQVPLVCKPYSEEVNFGSCETKE